MSSSVKSTGMRGSRLKALDRTEKIRFGAFTLILLALLGLNVMMTPMEVLTAAFTGWVQEFGIHQVHDMTVAAVLWLAFIVPIVLLFYHPTGRVNTILAPVIAAIPIASMAALAESFLAMGFAVMSGFALLALLFHPAGRSLARFDRVEGVDRRLAGWYVIGALPVLAYAALEVGNQLGRVDEHVLFVHYGAMAVAAVLIVVMGFLAVFRQRDWRFAAWHAGLLGAFIGLASMVYPGIESSLGQIGGALLLLWAIVFVAGVEYVRRRDTGDDDGQIGEPVAESA